MKTTEMTCIVCPSGCRITVVQDEAGRIQSVTGNSCVRGADYAAKEVTAPERVLTTTVKIEGEACRMLPVKTDGPIPKEAMLEAMDRARKITVRLPIRLGDKIASDFIRELTTWYT